MMIMLISDWLTGNQDPLPDLIVPAANNKRAVLGDQTGNIANSPRGLHTSLEGGLDNLALLNIGTPPLASSSSAGNTAAQESDENKDPAPATFERTGNKNRASERYHIPHKKAVKDQQQKSGDNDKENFLTPVGTPRRSSKRVGQEQVTLISDWLTLKNTDL